MSQMPPRQDDTVRTKEGLDDATGVAVVFDEEDEDEVRIKRV